MWRDHRAARETAEPPTAEPDPSVRRQAGWWRSFGEGLLVQLANPKAGARAWLSRRPIRRRLDAAAGTVLVALGLRVAVSGR